MKKLPKKVKEEWLKALKSGNYDKGKGTLCGIDSKGNARYCCLGVLAEVINGEDSWVVYEFAPGVNCLAINNVANYYFGPGNGYAALTQKDENLEMPVGDLLADINDKNDTFEPIIEYIEKNL